MRAFVTGARGFVGSWLIPRLVEEGAEVIGVDREVDVRDASQVAAAVAAAAPDAIVHLAAWSSVAGSYREPREVFRVNYLGARSVLQAVARHAVQARVLLVGSGTAYGSAPPGSPTASEDAPLRPVSPYARAKAAADLLGARFAAQGLDVVRARPFNHLGPGQSDEFVAASFARQIAEMEACRRARILHVGNLDSMRDFLDVTDVADAYVRLLDRRVPPGAYNVARGRGISIRELLDRLLERARTRPEVRVDPARLRPTDVVVGNPRRLQEATGWRPMVPLDETLTRVLDDWRARILAP